MKRKDIKTALVLDDLANLMKKKKETREREKNMNNILMLAIIIIECIFIAVHISN